MNRLTNGIGWGGTNGGGVGLVKDNYKSKTGSYKKIIIIWGLSIVMSIAPLHAFTKSLLDDRQFQCVKKLWYKESRWNSKAISRTHDYGIPQRHMKKASNQAKAKFLENPYAQILWGLSYIEHRYDTPCNAWAHSQRKGWY